MDNKEIARILRNIAIILEIQGDTFRVRAYQRAAQSIDGLLEDISEVSKKGELQDIPGVGKHIAAKIEELVNTGKLQYYENLRKEIKIDIEALSLVPSLGPKKIKFLYEKLKIKNLKDLKKALVAQKVRELPGFGEKSELSLLENVDKKKKKRFAYKEVAPIVREFLRYFKKCEVIEKVDVAGSFRRKKSTVGDLDFLVVSKDPKKVADHFVAFKHVARVTAKGKKRSAIILKNELQIDLRIVMVNQYGSALLYFTGSKEHNVYLRRLALQKGLTLNEYGLYTVKDKKWVAGKTEEEIYTKLGLQWVKPQKRER